jgi:hypothetical protein
MLTVTVQASVGRGSYPFTITGTGGSPTVSHNVSATLVKVQQK